MASYIARSARANSSSALLPGSIIATPTLAVATSPTARACSPIAAASAAAAVAAPRLVDADQDHGELVAADPGGDVGRAQALAERGGDAGEQLVAGGVAVEVVDGLEAVEVDHRERGALAVARAALDLALELLLEAAAVGEARERVVLGLVAQLLLQLAALGEVLDLADEVQRPAVLVGRQRDRQQRPDHAPVGVDVALVHLVGRAPAGEHVVDEREVGVEVVGVREVLERELQQLLLGVADELAQRLVDVEPLALEPDQRHADRRVVERGAELLRDALERLLRIQGVVHHAIIGRAAGLLERAAVSRRASAAC